MHVNGSRVKASRVVRPGDRLAITRGVQHFEIDVRALAERRGPAREAEALYEETPVSIARRAEEAERRRLAREAAGEQRVGRPSKRDRRALDRFRGRETE